MKSNRKKCRVLNGRIEVVCDRKKSVMNIKNVWYEKNAKSPTVSELLACVERFAGFNQMKTIQWAFSLQN